MSDSNKRSQLLYTHFFSMMNQLITDRFRVNQLIKDMRSNKTVNLNTWKNTIDTNQKDPWICVFGDNYKYFNLKVSEIETIAESTVYVDIQKYKAFVKGEEEILRRIEIFKILSCLCMDYWSKEESKRSESIIALILEEIKHSIFKEKHPGIQAILCWNTLDKGLKEMFFTLFFNHLYIWHLNPINRDRTDFENLRLFKA